MNKEEFVFELKKIGIKIENDMLSKLDTYYKMLINYNEHTNLTRITKEKEVYLKHFYDSLTIAKVIDLSNQSLLDIGSGAGFPGIVLKVVYPNLKITLLDSLNKRVIFLNDVIEKLDLKGIKAVHTRAEDYILENREKFDIVTSRAVANLSILSELCIPYVKIGGYFIAMKTDDKNEIINAKKAIETLGSVIKDTVYFELPIDHSKRSLIKIEKNVKTSLKYPRKFNEIKKKSL